MPQRPPQPPPRGRAARRAGCQPGSGRRRWVGRLGADLGVRTQPPYGPVGQLSRSVLDWLAKLPFLGSLNNVDLQVFSGLLVAAVAVAAGAMALGWLWSIWDRHAIARFFQRHRTWKLPPQVGWRPRCGGRRRWRSLCWQGCWLEGRPRSPSATGAPGGSGSPFWCPGCSPPSSPSCATGPASARPRGSGPPPVRPPGRGRRSRAGWAGRREHRREASLHRPHSLKEGAGTDQSVEVRREAHAVATFNLENLGRRDWPGSVAGHPSGHHASPTGAHRRRHPLLSRGSQPGQPAGPQPGRLGHAACRHPVRILRAAHDQDHRRPAVPGAQPRDLEPQVHPGHRLASAVRPDRTFQYLGAGFYDTRINAERAKRNLIRQLEVLGYKVTLEPAA